ncbi:MAG: transcription termination factor NusA [Patescibacteria group bacterium]
MLDLKVFNSALDQLETEKGVSRDKIIEAISQALAAAYKKDYGKKGQIVRAHFDIASGKTEFEQVKIVVDSSTVRMPDEEEPEEGTLEDLRPRFNAEHHILIEDARKIKKGAELDGEIIFPLEAKDDYGRIAAQTAKQVIIQKIREAERQAILTEFAGRTDEVVSGSIQRIERGNVFVDLGRTVGLLPYEEQIPGEHYRQGGRIKAYVVSVSEGPRGVNVRLSRSHPEFLKKLFAVEAPEIAHAVVEIKAVAREPGARSKMAVVSHDPKVDPIGTCVGQRGVRVSTVMNELAGEKIDIIEWSDNPERFITFALSPSKIMSIEVHAALRQARVTVAEDQMSLAIGKGGQNVRLAAKLTGWRIDIEGAGGETIAQSNGEEIMIEGKDAEEESPLAETLAAEGMPMESTEKEESHEVPHALVEDEEKGKI